MIVSHAKQFIFIKTRKTAGTTVEIALSQFCGPNDIITELSPDQERLRAECGHRTAQNVAIPFAQLRPRRTLRALAHRRRPFFFNHMPAQEVRSAIGREPWENYFTFAVERNPWDRAISLYHWFTADIKNRPTLTDYLRRVSVVAPYRLSNWHMYTIGGSVVLDRVLLYENLLQDLRIVWDAMGEPTGPMLPRANSYTRADRRHYSEVMTAEDRDIIAAVCRFEIEHFGYTFDTQSQPG